MYRHGHGVRELDQEPLQEMTLDPHEVGRDRRNPLQRAVFNRVISYDKMLLCPVILDKIRPTVHYIVKVVK